MPKVEKDKMLTAMDGVVETLTMLQQGMAQTAEAAHAQIDYMNNLVAENPTDAKLGMRLVMTKLVIGEVLATAEAVALCASETADAVVKHKRALRPFLEYVEALELLEGEQGDEAEE